MNIYEKLQTCRVELQNANVKKTGKNDYAGYDYFELADFLPYTNELFLEHKLTSVITYDSEVATLTIINIEKPEEQIRFTSPMAKAALKGCHDIQNLGAVETYQRRYLYMTALEIVENDALDGGTSKENQPQQQAGAKARNARRSQQRQQQQPQQKQQWQTRQNKVQQLPNNARAAVTEQDKKARAALWATCRGVGLEDSELIKAWILRSWADSQNATELLQSTTQVPMEHIKHLTGLLKSGKMTAHGVAVYVDSFNIVGQTVA